MPQLQVSKCVDCGATITSNDKTCPYCSAPNPNWHNPEEKDEPDSSYIGSASKATAKAPTPTQIANRWFAIMLLFVGIASLLYVTNLSKTKASVNKVDKPKTWIYEKDPDIQGFDKATICSENVVGFKNYPGLEDTINVYAFFTLSHKNSDREYTLFTIKLKEANDFSQVIESDSNCVKIQFDDMQPQKFEAFITNINFALMVSDNNGQIMAGLRKSKAMVITAYFRNNPSLKFRFNISNLNWNH